MVRGRIYGFLAGIADDRGGNGSRKDPAAKTD
jgi:hypothetical protein